MTLSYRCSKCGAMLETSNADPLHAEIERLRAALEEIAKGGGWDAHIALKALKQ